MHHSLIGEKSSKWIFSVLINKYFREFIEDVWIKDEYVLCILSYDRNSRLLSVYPDFSTTEAYTIRTVRENMKKIYYYIENCSIEMANLDDQKEQELLGTVSIYKCTIVFTSHSNNSVHIWFDQSLGTVSFTLIVCCLNIS